MNCPKCGVMLVEGETLDTRNNRRRCIPCKKRYHADYRAKNAEKINKRKRSDKSHIERRAANIDAARAYERMKAAEYRAADPEKHRAARRAYYAANKDRVKSQAKSSRQRRLPTILASNAKRKADLRNATPPNADLSAIARIYALAKRLESITGQKYHVDHVIPLAKGGLHHQDNLVVMRQDYNTRKSDLIIDDLIRFFTPYGRPHVTSA